MSLKLPNDKIVYNLQEQVGVNAENIKYLAEVYKDIDSIPTQYAELKADYEDNIKTYFDDTMKPTFAGWTTTFEGWDTTLSTYLASMSSAAVSAISGQSITPANVSVSNNLRAEYLKPITGDFDGAGASFTINNPPYTTITTFYKHGRISNGKMNIVIGLKLVVSQDFTASGVGWIAHNGAFYIPETWDSHIYNINGSNTAVGSGSIIAVMSQKAIQVSNDPAKTIDLFCSMTKESAQTLYFRVAMPDQSVKAGTYAVRFEFNIIL